ncbi:MAG: hypothetical protein ACR2HJ_06230 [Fimbriimonadales bacterium]
MRKVSRIALVLLACSGARAQDPDPKVTYSTVAVPIKRALADIAKATGAKIDVAGQAAAEIVIINVKDAPLSQVMAKIAKVTSGEWVKDAEGIQWLNYSSVTLQKDRQAAADMRVADVTKSLKQMADRLSPAPDIRPAGSETPDDEEVLPQPLTGISKAIIRISSLVSPAAIASVDDGERLVFASTPTRMQRPLGNIGSIIADLVQEHNAGALEREKIERESEETNPKTVEQKKEEEDTRRTWGRFDRQNFDKPITAPIAKVLFIISKEGFGFFGGGATIELKLFDAEGKVVLSGQDSLGAGFDPMGMMGASAPGNTQAAPKQGPTNPPIEYSDTTKELSGFFDFTGGGNDFGSKKPSERLLEKLLRPDNYDPLSFQQSEALLAVARAKGVNLIANLPDNVVSFMDTFNAKGKATVDDYLEDLKNGESVTIDSADGWMTVRPASPAKSRELRVDRFALAALIGGGHAKGVPSLDDLAAYALKCEQPSETPIVMPYVMLFAQHAFSQGMRGPTDWSMLRFYGQLTLAQRESLKAGSQLSMRSLLPQQKDLVTKMAFGSPPQIKVERPGDKPADEGGFMEMMSSFMPSAVVDYKDEPTEVMPSGLPADAYVTLKLTEDNVVVPQSAEGKDIAMFGALGTDELAIFQYMKESPEFGEMGGMMPQIDRVRLGSRRVLDFTFQLGVGVSLKETLLDDNLPKNSDAISTSALPAEFQARIRKRVEALKKTKMPWFGGRADPPKH